MPVNMVKVTFYILDLFQQKQQYHYNSYMLIFGDYPMLPPLKAIYITYPFQMSLADSYGFFLCLPNQMPFKLSLNSNHSLKNTNNNISKQFKHIGEGSLEHFHHISLSLESSSDILVHISIIKIEELRGNTNTQLTLASLYQLKLICHLNSGGMLSYCCISYQQTTHTNFEQHFTLSKTFSTSTRLCISQSLWVCLLSLSQTL